MIPILFQDERYVFVDKPSGLLVHRTSESVDQDVLLQRVRDQVGKRIYPVHRLDRGASGVIGFAFSSEHASRLQTALQSATKTYVALVRGDSPSEGEIQTPLHDDDGVPRECRTSFSRIDGCQYCSLLKLEITTGRRHQIRRHLSSITHHILGDVEHGKGRLNQFYRDNYSLNRLFLHAMELKLPEEGLRIFASLPEELMKVLEKLAQEGHLKSETLARLRHGA